MSSLEGSEPLSDSDTIQQTAIANTNAIDSAGEADFATGAMTQETEQVPRPEDTTSQGQSARQDDGSDSDSDDDFDVREKLRRAWMNKAKAQSFVSIVGSSEVVKTVQTNYVKQAPKSIISSTTDNDDVGETDLTALYEKERAVAKLVDNVLQEVIDVHANDEVVEDDAEVEDASSPPGADATTEDVDVAATDVATDTAPKQDKDETAEDIEGVINENDDDAHDSDHADDVGDAESEDGRSQTSEHDNARTQDMTDRSAEVGHDDAQFVAQLQEQVEASRAAAESAQAAALAARQQADDAIAESQQSQAVPVGGGDGFFLTAVDGPAELTTIDQLRIALAESAAKYAESQAVIASRDAQIVSLAHEAIDARTQSRTAAIAISQLEARAAKAQRDLFRAYDLLEEQAEDARKKHESLLNAAFSDMPEERFEALAMYVDEEKNALVHQVQHALEEINAEKDHRILADGGIDWREIQEKMRAEHMLEIKKLKDSHALEISLLKSSMKDSVMDIVSEAQAKANKRVADAITEEPVRMPSPPQVVHNTDGDGDGEEDLGVQITDGELGAFFDELSSKVDDRQILPSGRKTASRASRQRSSRASQSRGQSRGQSRSGRLRTPITPTTVSVDPFDLGMVPEPNEEGSDKGPVARSSSQPLLHQEQETSTLNIAESTDGGGNSRSASQLAGSRMSSTAASQASDDEDGVAYQSPYANNRAHTLQSKSEFLKSDQAVLEEIRLRNWGTERGVFPTGDVTLVFAAIAHAEELWQSHPQLAAKSIQIANANIREQIALNQGHEVFSKGDRYIFAFARATDAVKFAVDIQRDLIVVEWPKRLLKLNRFKEAYDDRLVRNQRGLTLHIGVHCGLPVSKVHPVTGVPEYRGPVVILASRAASTAAPGQIIVSKRVANEVGDLSGFKSEAKDLGMHRLAGLTGEHELVQVSPHAFSRREFGSLETVTTILAVQQDKVKQLSTTPSSESLDLARAKAKLEMMEKMAKKVAASSQDACFAAFVTDINAPVRNAKAAEVSVKSIISKGRHKSAGAAKGVSWSAPTADGTDSSKPPRAPQQQQIVSLPADEASKISSLTSRPSFVATDEEFAQLKQVVKTFDTAVDRFRENQLVLGSPSRRRTDGLRDRPPSAAEIQQPQDSGELLHLILQRMESASDLLKEASAKTESLPVWDGKDQYVFSEAAATEEGGDKDSGDDNDGGDGPAAGEEDNGGGSGDNQAEDSEGNKPPPDHATLRLRQLEVSRQLLYEHPDFVKVRDLNQAATSLRFKLLATKHEIRKLSNWTGEIDHWIKDIPSLALRINLQRAMLRRLKREAGEMEGERNRALAERKYLIKDLKRIIGNMLDVDWKHAPPPASKNSGVKEKKKLGKLEWRINSNSASALDGPIGYLGGGGGPAESRIRRRERRALPPVQKQGRTLRPSKKTMSFQESEDPSSISMNSFRNLRRAIVSPQERLSSEMLYAPRPPIVPPPSHRLPGS